MTATAVRRPRRSPASIVSKVQQFLVLRDEEKQVKTRKDALAKNIAEYIDNSVDEDSDGHRFLKLPGDGFNSGKKVYTAIQRQKRVSTRFAEDVAEEILKERGLYEEATETVTVIDQDKVYALNAMGQLSDEDIDRMLVQTVTYATVPVSE